MKNAAVVYKYLFAFLLFSFSLQTQAYNANKNQGKSRAIHGDIFDKKTGKVISSGSVLSYPSTSDVQLAAAEAPSRIGEQHTLVFLVRFQNTPNYQPFSVAYMTEMMFGSGNSVSNYFKEQSYGQSWLAGDVTQWLTVPMDSTAAVANSNVDMVSQVATMAQEAATKAGYILSNYKRFVYIVPQFRSPNYGGTGLIYSGAWVVQYNFNVIAHEIGHNFFGVGHSHSWDCDVSAVGNNCKYSEYGDIFDVMGNGHGGHFNAIQKELIGWLGATSSPSITTVTSSGNYTIEPFSTLGTNAKALKIRKGTDARGTPIYYYLEYRQPRGFDRSITDYIGNDVQNIFNGVLVHQNLDTWQPILLDMTPGSNERNSAAASDAHDPALQVGQSFYDVAAGVTITLLSTSSTGAVVNVNFSAVSASCVRAAPLVSVANPSATISSSGEAVYNVTVTNQDSSDCGTSTFNLGVGPGVYTAYGKQFLNIAPGASASTTITVSYPSSAVTNLTIMAASSSSVPTVGTANVTLTVDANNTCVTTRPLVTITANSSTFVAAGTPVSYTLKVTNRDTSACPTDKIVLRGDLPDGWSGQLSSSTLILAPGASSSVTFTVQSLANSKQDTYPLSITAIQGSRTWSPIAFQTTYTVGNQTLCVRANPTIEWSIPSTVLTGLAGSQQTFWLDLINNDSYGCGPSHFVVSTLVPSGWVGALTDTYLPVNPGGGRSTFRVNVTSPTTALPGSYSFSVSASNLSYPNFSGSGNGTYEVRGICTRANPTATLSPSTQSGVAGSKLIYTLTVSNNDSAECLSSAFSLRSTSSSQFNIQFEEVVDRTFVVAPGLSASTPISTTSSTYTPVGSYAFSLTVANGLYGQDIYNATANATNVVESNPYLCIKSNPTVSISPSSQSGTPGSTRNYTLSVKNNDSAACDPTRFTMNKVIPSGWSSSFANSTLSLAPGSTASTVFSLTSLATSTNGSYDFSLSAVNSYAAAYSATANGNYTISTLAIGVLANKSSYLKNETVNLTANVTFGGNAVSGATVNFTITKPDGSIVTKSVVTDSTGKAIYSLRLGRKFPSGLYQVRVTVNYNGQNASGSTSFSVQ